MGRKRDVFVREYYNESSGQAECKSCGKNICSVSTTNLKRHLLKDHKELISEYEKRLKLQDTETDQSDEKIKFKVEMSKNEIINACIDMVTKESQPLSFFDSSSFKTLTELIFNALNISPINSRNIMDHVHVKSEKIKKRIMDTLSERVFCLKIDAATRCDRSVLGINVQLLIDNEIVIYTLGMIELQKRHTGENLKHEIENVLENFKIDKKQVYSVTTDNGRNMIKAVELLSSSQSEDEEQFEDGSADFSENIVNNITFENMISIKCAAHCLHLAVKDFLVEFSSTIISKARQVVKILRTPAYRYKIKSLNIRKPQMDVATRWNSTYDMLKRLLELKEFCVEHLQTFEQLEVHEWVGIENIVSVLAPLHILALKLQRKQLLLGDFYKFWLDMTFQLKAINSDISNKALTHVESRQTRLLENDTMYAALFLDPRFRRLLSSEKKEAAKRHLKKIVYRIQDVQKQNSQLQLSATTSGNGEEESFLFDESTSSLLRSGIRELELANNSSSDEEELEINDNIRKAFYEIDNYKEKRIDVDADLMDYWNNKKYAFPWLYKLACIVHSIPATQVSVERSFSALRLILGDLRYNLSEQNLAAIMIVKLNSDVIP